MNKITYVQLTYFNMKRQTLSNKTCQQQIVEFIVRE